MQLTPKITQILNHLEKIQPFNPQSSLDGARKYLETMSFQLSGKKESVAMQLHRVPWIQPLLPVLIWRIFR